MEKNSALAELISAKSSVKIFTIIAAILLFILLNKSVIIAINLPIFSEIMHVLAFVFIGVGAIILAYLYFKYKKLETDDKKSEDLIVRIGLMALLIIIMGLVCAFNCHEIEISGLLKK